MMSELVQHPIKRLLVANRGEIATRILSAARELSIPTLAVYTEGDATHAYNADAAALLPSPASYLDPDALLAIVKSHGVDAVHPGYGFLSESAEFAARLHEAGVRFVGPSHEVLAATGDKLAARALAVECSVPVLPALTTPTDDVQVVRRFAVEAGWPVMIKAVDGGGGRGIRLVRSEAELQARMDRAIEESPSRKVFVEKAAIDGYRHVEVQIVGDAKGNVTHLWDRECSIQRRYQKVVEIAPSTLKDRKIVNDVIESALRIARRIKYRSLGTFEFLVGEGRLYFLEVNPRLQVEHTITESICSTDLVRAQLLIAQGETLEQVGFKVRTHAEVPPPLHSIQLRITAEEPSRDWTLSVGKIQSSHFPSGNGVRCDTNIVSGMPAAVTADFDSLLAKLIITASSWQAALQKARRALDDVRIEGVQTNVSMLKAIIHSQDFARGECDTTWLESNMSRSLASIPRNPPQKFGHDLFRASSAASVSLSAPSSSQLLFKKDDAWTISLDPTARSEQAEGQQYHLHLNKLLKNDFPSSLAAEISVTSTAGTTRSSPSSFKLVVEQTSLSASAAATASSRPRYNPQDPSHVAIPFAGRLVEVHVDAGDEIEQGETLFVIRQMKMELEVRAPRSGRVEWVLDVQEGEDVGEGWLGAVLLPPPDDGARRETKL